MFLCLFGIVKFSSPQRCSCLAIKGAPKRPSGPLSELPPSPVFCFRPRYTHAPPWAVCFSTVRVRICDGPLLKQQHQCVFRFSNQSSVLLSPPPPSSSFLLSSSRFSYRFISLKLFRSLFFLCFFDRLAIHGHGVRDGALPPPCQQQQQQQDG